MAIETERSFHVLIRFSDLIVDVEDTVAEHLEILDAQDYAWFGKFGKPLGHQHIARLNTQIQSGVTTYLFLAQKKGNIYSIYEAVLASVTRELASSERVRVPGYYRSRSASTWFAIQNLRPIDRFRLGDFHIASSGRPVIGTLKRSMAACFVLQSGRSYFDY